jgi:hypothetical protein
MPHLILTEENPQIAEVQYIVNALKISSKITGLEPVLDSGSVWTGKFAALSNTTIVPNLYIQLFKGKGACVDYMVYDTLTPTEKTTPVLLLESTKTSDTESRNSSVYQRFTKFAVVKLTYPTTPLVLFYTMPQNPHTATALFGLRLLKTHGVTVIDSTGKDLLLNVKPFTSVDDLIQAKNSMAKRANNVSVEITKTGEHSYSISAKLCKGEAKDLNHDPNIGLITGLCSAMSSLDKEASFLITNHGLNTEKLTPTAKFWYANRNHCLMLEGCSLDSRKAVYTPMPLTFESQSEKAATILFELLTHKEKKLETLFHNHSSSARSSFLLPNKTVCQVPKDCSIPDIVLLDSTNKTIYICEGKIHKDIQLGVTQLDALQNFETFLKGHYKESTVQKGLCVFLPKGKKSPVTKYPIWFTLNADGSYSFTL